MKADIHAKSKMRQEELSRLREQLSVSEKQQCHTEEQLTIERNKILKLQVFFISNFETLLKSQCFCLESLCLSILFYQLMSSCSYPEILIISL